MPKKAKAKSKSKSRPFVEKSELRGQTPLSASDVKKYQKLIESIGLRKKRGFIIIGEVISETDEGVGMSTLGFLNKMNKMTVIKDMLRAIGVEGANVIKL